MGSEPSHCLHSTILLGRKRRYTGPIEQNQHGFLILFSMSYTPKLHVSLYNSCNFAPLLNSDLRLVVHLRWLTALQNTNTKLIYTAAALAATVTLFCNYPTLALSFLFFPSLPDKGIVSIFPGGGCAVLFAPRHFKLKAFCEPNWTIL